MKRYVRVLLLPILVSYVTFYSPLALATFQRTFKVAEDGFTAVKTKERLDSSLDLEEIGQERADYFCENIPKTKFDRAINWTAKLNSEGMDFNGKIDKSFRISKGNNRGKIVRPFIFHKITCIQDDADDEMNTLLDQMNEFNNLSKNLTPRKNPCCKDGACPIRSSPSDQNSQHTAERKVTFLKQIHWVDPKYWDGPVNVEKYTDDVARSQFAILDYISKNPNSVVFGEGLGMDISLEDLNLPARKNSKYYSKIRQNIQLRQNLINAIRDRVLSIQEDFPNGIPPSLEDFTPKQKESLAINGAEYAALALGIIPELKATQTIRKGELIDKEISELVSSRARDQVRKQSRREKELMFNVREENLKKKILKYFNKRDQNDDQEAIIVFGGSHNLRKYFPEGNPDQIVFESVETYSH